MKHLLDLTIDDLAAELAKLGQPAFRAKQVAAWVYAKGATNFATMTDLPAALRPELAARMAILTGKVAARKDSADGVIKLLIEWHDGERIETVLIPSGTAREDTGETPATRAGILPARLTGRMPVPRAAGRATACVSTQAGCALGCTFCASGEGGLKRNLTAGEIVEQIFHLQQAAGRKVTHVVFMGTGEPLANYEATVGAVRAIIDPPRLGISARRVTISTVGLPKAIRRLAAEDMPITLAISLHAPNDALRRQIMPAAAAVPIADIVAAAQEFFQSRSRELTLEYVLLAGVNDTNVCADGLARIAGRLRCNVNLIRYNPVPEAPYKRPSQTAVREFADRLARLGVNVQVRRSRGADADAACGQLRRRVGAGSEGQGQ
ncbi:MAG: 23S rRNA (adenine(2503)-C(2))-methyltransferase RlmN [Phycisphaerae bacterium]